MSLFVELVHESAKAPIRAHATDAGYDLRCIENVWLPAGAPTKVRTGIKVRVPAGHYGRIAERSSLALKGICVGGGVIDAGFTGELQVILTYRPGPPSGNPFGGAPSSGGNPFGGTSASGGNPFGGGTSSSGGDPFGVSNPFGPVHMFSRGDKIAQLILERVSTPPVEVVDQLPDTDRGASGFGSTGQ